MAKEPAYRIKNMMPGMIMLWYGSVASIPSGWHLCDGTMGTPNLSQRFIMGVGGGVNPDNLGGAVSHSHDFTGDGHQHDIPEGTGLAAGTDFYPNTTSDPATGTTETGLSNPRWYALCYIMKL